MNSNDAISVERGRDGFCLLTIRDGGEEYSLPLVFWPEIESVVHADFYKWAALAKAHTETQDVLRRLKEVIL